MQSGRWNWELRLFSPLLSVCSFNCRQRLFFTPSVSLSILPSLSFSLSLAWCSLKALCSLLVRRRVGAVPSGLQQQGDIYQFNVLACYKYTCQPFLHSTLLYSLSCSHSLWQQREETAELGGRVGERGSEQERVLCLQFMLSLPERS